MNVTGDQSVWNGNSDRKSLSVLVFYKSLTNCSLLSDTSSFLTEDTRLLSGEPLNALTAEAYERRINRLEGEKSELSRKLFGNLA